MFNPFNLGRRAGFAPEQAGQPSRQHDLLHHVWCLAAGGKGGALGQFEGGCGGSFF
jgi:hypothetical protein